MLMLVLKSWSIRMLYSFISGHVKNRIHCSTGNVYAFSFISVLLQIICCITVTISFMMHQFAYMQQNCWLCTIQCNYQVSCYLRQDSGTATLYEIGESCKWIWKSADYQKEQVRVDCENIETYVWSAYCPNASPFVGTWRSEQICWLSSVLY